MIATKMLNMLVCMIIYLLYIWQYIFYYYYKIKFYTSVQTYVKIDLNIENFAFQ